MPFFIDRLLTFPVGGLGNENKQDKKRTMLFNSFGFLAFFPVVCLVYFRLRNNRWRIPFLLLASYYFYMSWKPVYALLILTSTVLTYGCGLLVERYAGNRRRQKGFLVASLVINFGILFLYKYYNFLGENITALLDTCGLAWQVPRLDVLLPVGISFYTFQAVGYSIDVYRGTIRAVRNFATYALFVSFFPQLVAGPIERAGSMLPQFHAPARRFNYESVRSGLIDMAIGLFKKVVIADRIAIYIDTVYSNPESAAGLPALLAVVFFAFQLYIDFSAYTQIAIGAARVMGFHLNANFRHPYLAGSFKDFWSRWHITLTNWFRDYLYIPLGGNRKGRARAIVNTLVVFAVSGLWHGASWNFAIWGLLNGLALAVFDKVLHLEPHHAAGRAAYRLFVVAYWTLTLVFFRAADFHQAMQVFGSLGFANGKSLTDFGLGNIELIFSVVMLVALMVAEALSEHKREHFTNLLQKHFLLRWPIYILLVLGIIYLGVYGNGSDASFIYFQF